MNYSNTDRVRLRPRLHTVASFVPAGASLGDIGTDHAYLPVYLTQEGIISKAVGVDIHKGPYESAQETVRIYKLNDRIDIRLGNGLAPLAVGEVNTLTIAGMGGTTILEILNTNKSVLERVSTLILQPQGAEARVRQELLTSGWRIKDECLVEEDDRIYTVICLTKAYGQTLEAIKDKIKELITAINQYRLSNKVKSSQIDIHINKAGDHSKNPTVKDFTDIERLIWKLGPLIIAKKDELLHRILEEAIDNYRRIIREMGKTERKDIIIQAERLKGEIDILEGIQKWLFQ